VIFQHSFYFIADVRERAETSVHCAILQASEFTRKAVEANHVTLTQRMLRHAWLLDVFPTRRFPDTCLMN